MGSGYFYSLHPITKMLCYAKWLRVPKLLCGEAKLYLMFTTHHITSVRRETFQRQCSDWVNIFLFTEMGPGYFYSLHPTTKTLCYDKWFRISKLLWWSYVIFTVYTPSHNNSQITKCSEDNVLTEIQFTAVYSPPLKCFVTTNDVEFQNYCDEAMLY